MKTCPKCKLEFDATAEYFFRDKARADGLAWCCKACHAGMQGRDKKFPTRPASYTGNSDTTRRCSRCHKVKKLSLTNFYRNNSARAKGYGYLCKPCSAATSKAYNSKRPVLLRNLLRGYKRYDKNKHLENNLTIEALEKILPENINCVYCGRVCYGLDRIDNNKGHTVSNVVPCCRECNVIRGAELSYTEMKKLGPTLAEIYEKRHLQDRKLDRRNCRKSWRT